MSLDPRGWSLPSKAAAALSAALLLLLARHGRELAQRLKLALVDLVMDRAISKLTSKAGARSELGTLRTKDELEFRGFVNAPDTLGELFATNSRVFADREFVVHLDAARNRRRALTFGEAQRQSEALQRGLRDPTRGCALRRGERVAILMANEPEFMTTFMAVTSAGAVAVALNAFWSGEESAFGIQDAQAAVLVADRRRLLRLLRHDPQLAALRSGADLRKVVLVGGADDLRDEDGDSAQLLAGAAEFIVDFATLVDEFASAGSSEPAGRSAMADDTACIMYTSGTTSGRPKGVCLSHRSFVQATYGFVLFADLMEALRGPSKDRRCELISSPLFHASQFASSFLLAFLVGSKLVLLPKWNADAAVAAMQSERITHCGFMPLMLVDLLANESFRSAKDQLALQSVGTGGAATPSELIRRLHAALPHLSQGSGWGMTETNAVGTIIGGPAYLAKPTSCGRAHVLADVKLTDPVTGLDLPPGAAQEGELNIRSVCNMQGYWQRPEETAAALRRDGWVRTGDLGRVDDGGFVYITDRLKDVCIRGGENISVIEVADRLYQMDARRIVEVECFGVAHPRYGEQLLAAVCVAPGKSQHLSESAIKDYAAQHLAPFKVPSRVFVRDFSTAPLPRGATGKVLKRALREEYENQI